MNISKIDEFNNSKISLNRKIMEWEWYTEPKTSHLFIHCLLRANFKDNRYQGIAIKRGQFLTSIAKLSIETGLSFQEVRTALKRLNATHELTQEKHSQYSIITVNNYNKYQENLKKITRKTTSEQQAINKQLTTNNNDNNEINNTYIYKETENKKTKMDPYINPVKKVFSQEYEKIFNNKARLSNQMCHKLIELSSEIEDFKETIPTVLKKLKNISFKYSDNSTYKATLPWLLKDDNYFKVLEGQFDKQQKSENKKRKQDDAIEYKPFSEMTDDEKKKYLKNKKSKGENLTPEEKEYYADITYGD